jgi:hypothetical protein
MSGAVLAMIVLYDVVAQILRTWMVLETFVFQLGTDKANLPKCPDRQTAGV